MKKIVICYLSQFSTISAAVADDFDSDGTLDVVVAGNFYPVNVQMGRYDASYGLFIKNDGKGHFTAVPPVESGIQLIGETRKLRKVKVGGREIILAIRNNDTVAALAWDRKRKEN